MEVRALPRALPLDRLGDIPQIEPDSLRNGSALDGRSNKGSTWRQRQYFGELALERVDSVRIEQRYRSVSLGVGHALALKSQRQFIITFVWAQADETAK
ncbi:MAG: hypothetical protein Q8K82_15460 [Gemmatimonadaceae bacterium]|nr:hypothetical protein [Gemmatimonadaceae bacterium]